MVQDGKLCAAVRMVTDLNDGGLYRPTDLDLKTGQPVIDVLRYNHLGAHILQADYFDEYQDEPDNVGIFYIEEDTTKHASHLSRAAGPSGVDEETLKHWLLWFGVYSEKLWEKWLSGLLPTAIACMTMPFDLPSIAIIVNTSSMSG